MATYPGAVFTKANIVAGATSDPTDVNDLSAEITAIEDGLLNGTAPLTCSNATVNRLNVSASSTFAGAATFSTTVSFSTTVTFTARPVSPPPAAVRLGLQSVVDLTQNTTLAVAWTRQTFITNSTMHSTASNPSQLLPQSTGIYAISVGLTLSNNHGASTGRFAFDIEDSSGTIVGGASNNMVDLGGGNARVNVTALKHFDDLTATPWVRVVVINRDSSTNSLSTLSYVSMHKL